VQLKYKLKKKILVVKIKTACKALKFIIALFCFLLEKHQSSKSLWQEKNGLLSEASAFLQPGLNDRNNLELLHLP
jgi:hypothetical protein